MSNNQEPLLKSLMGTAVGRRWLLKAGLGSAAAIAAATLPVWSSSAGAAGLAQPTPGVAPSTTTTSSTAKRTLQFALTPAIAGGVSNLTLSANGARLPLVEHTSDSRAALKAQGGLFAHADLAKLTHYVADVALPADRALLLSVHGRHHGEQVVVAQSMHVPAATTLAMAQLAASSPSGLKSMTSSDDRLASLGMTATQVTTPEQVVQLDAIIDLHNTAVTLASLHPQVATVDLTGATATRSLLQQTTEVVNLGNYMTTMQAGGTPWSKLVTATDADGSASQITVGTTTTTFQTLQLNPTNDSNFQSAAKSAVSAGVVAVRDTAPLGTAIDKPIDQYPLNTSFNTWVQPLGVTPQPTPYAPPSVAAVTGGNNVVHIKNTGLLYGTYTNTTGGLTGTSVPIRIYNNYVRWMWAYVQYWGTDANGNATNLSFNPNASWPDTQYSKSLALLPQVFTVLGVPLWDTNTVDVTLDFPAGAHTARLLYCGLGNDIYGGGWRQWFPSDAYPDLIAPTDEVLFPALLTGIVTIGLNIFALAADMNIALTWAAIRKSLINQSSYEFVWEALEQVVNRAGTLALTEAAAVLVAGGAETYGAIAGRGDNVDNLWSILLGIASVIPKLLFNPGAIYFWADVGAGVLGNLAASKIIEAVPIIGEVMSILSVIGDAATLAEVSAETATSPWVIENEVNLQYQVNLTISHDPAASGWPATAATWELSYALDGAATAASVQQGDMNVGGRTGSDPLALTATAPFGSNSIQWTIVIKDSDGYQVGTGASSSYANNDQNNLQTEVSFAITELPEPINSQTVFSRADTFIYSDTADGYTWSNATSDLAAANSAVPSSSSPIQQVAGVSVATTLGVVGTVWKQNDRFYLQGVPVDENGATVSLQTPATEGYSRQPFLLFDSFVHRDNPTESNHVLLEPDPTLDGYHVRKLSLDPDSGAISWDSSTSLGMFTLPVSAAALHSASGRVVTVHTDSGRVGMVHPVATSDPAHPNLAAYSAGQGTQIGLLQSPTAVAVTNPGIVIVLEAGAGQLAAFDLNGNPVKYFGSDVTNLQFTQPLATAGTYLDLAVDGASHIYLLYYTGDGSQPDDYHVDVYLPSGEPLNTQNAGVNVARLAVDYWRSIYGVNFTSMTAPGTTTTVALPSVSRFDPTSPPAPRAIAA